MTFPLPLHALYSPTLRRIDGAVLIACSTRKAPSPAYASELYQGALFRASVRYAQALGLPWAVLSAEYGLVLPTDVIAPYDRRITDLRATRRVVWGQQCVIDLFRRLGHPRRAILLAGRDYREHVEPQLHRRGVPEVVVPLAGLAIGLQRQRLAALIAEATPCA